MEYLIPIYALEGHVFIGIPRAWRQLSVGRNMSVRRPLTLIKLKPFQANFQKSKLEFFFLIILFNYM